MSNHPHLHPKSHLHPHSHPCRAHAPLPPQMHDPIKAIDSVAEALLLESEEYENIGVAAVDCASMSGRGVCKWLNIGNFPSYYTFVGERIEMDKSNTYYPYMEHHWTEFGTGEEIVAEMVQYLKHEQYFLQP